MAIAQVTFPSEGGVHSGTDALHKGCGSHELMLQRDRMQEGYLETMNDAMRSLSGTAVQNRTNQIYRIPVVFHIVFQNAAENLSDEVIQDQLEIMNSCFRRTNEDASETRSEFLNLVGDTRIEFQLAEFDPEGNPTTGITRTSTSITNFGGVLPYGPGQNTEIAQWVGDSLFYNYFRLANSGQGGIDAWDPQRYLNIWIGDLRILEPLFNNFQEIVFFAFATPPAFHPNWPSDAIPAASNFTEGVFIHYVNVGSNNPNSFSPPYQGFNGVNNGGKLAVHEIGHYLGLRHIWGDGNCSLDDFIDDTPNATSDAQWGCNLNANTCVDEIEGIDLPDMLENYMDYSSSNCQNAFTNGQIGLMQSVLDEFRPDLAEILVSVEEQNTLPTLSVYPNPSEGRVRIELPEQAEQAKLKIFDSIGKEVFQQDLRELDKIELSLSLPAGTYFIHLNTSESGYRTRLILQ